MFESFKGIFKGKPVTINDEEGIQRINVKVMEKLYEQDELTECAIMLKQLLEIYGNLKKKNHREKGREFVHFILSRKHKDLKNIGYTHWQNINKIIHLNQPGAYPYHKKNLRNAMDFYVKELKGIKVIDMKK